MAESLIAFLPDVPKELSTCLVSLDFCRGAPPAPSCPFLFACRFPRGAPAPARFPPRGMITSYIYLLSWRYYGAVQCSAGQCSTGQCKVVQCSAVLCCRRAIILLPSRYYTARYYAAAVALLCCCRGAIMLLPSRNYAVLLRILYSS